MPALPQHCSLSGTSRSVTPGMAASSARGWALIRCACARWQASHIATRSESGRRGARGEELVDVADLGGELPRGRIVGKEAGVVLEVRSAAGGIDEDEVHGLVREPVDQVAGELQRFMLPARVHRKRAAAALT